MSMPQLANRGLQASVRSLAIIISLWVALLVTPSTATDTGGPCPGSGCPRDSGGPETTMVLVDPNPRPSLFEYVIATFSLFF